MGFRVIAIDHGSKKSLCTECGAEKFLDFTQYTDAELAKAVKDITGGRGAHAVIVLNAANKAYEQSLNFLKPKGTLVCIGMPEGKPVPIQSAFPAFITMSQFTIIGKSVSPCLGNILLILIAIRLSHWQQKRCDRGVGYRR
jgi:propanol-preferring alcohol dehydrogenase